MSDRSRMVRSSIILFIFMMIGHVSNYLFQFIIGRFFTLKEFAAFNSVMSFFLIGSISSGTIMFVIAKYVSIFRVKEEGRKIIYFYSQSLKKVALAVTIFFIIFTALSKPIQMYLRIDSVLPVILVGFIIAVFYLINLNLGLLQGYQRFVYISAFSALSVALRLVLGIVLLYLGCRVVG